MFSTDQETARTISTDHTVKELIGQALFLGRSRISTISRQFYGETHSSPGTTAEAVARDAVFSARFMTVANTIQHGAGIAATNVEAATMRMGHERTKALAVTFAIGRALSPIAGHVAGFDRLWYTAMARGALARALAMHVDPRIAGPAFLTGALQDVGKIFFAAAEPELFPDMLTRSGGSSMRLALLEWQAFNRNHIHIGLEVLSGWGLPSYVTEAIGRHHTNPPGAATADLAVRLWQVGYVVGALPVGSQSEIDASPPAVTRLLATSFGVDQGGIQGLLQQALDEYHDVVELFRPIIAARVSGETLLAPVATALATGQPRADRRTRVTTNRMDDDAVDEPQRELHGLFSTHTS